MNRVFLFLFIALSGSCHHHDADYKTTGSIEKLDPALDAQARQSCGRSNRFLHWMIPHMVRLCMRATCLEREANARRERARINY